MLIIILLPRERHRKKNPVNEYLPFTREYQNENPKQESKHCKRKKKEVSNYPNPFKAGRISHKNQTKSNETKIEKTETGIGNSSK